MSATQPNRRKKSTPIAANARGQQTEKRITDSVRRGAISAFILFHLVAITCVAVPANFSLLSNIKQLLEPYMVWSGLFQRWDMFSPDPPTANSYVKTVVITGDRHLHTWSFPRMDELSYSERYRKERYRKFLEVLPQQQNAPLWPDVARNVAGQFKPLPDVLDKVLLIEFQSSIPPPADGSPEPAARPSVFYEDYVQPGDTP